MSTFEDTVSNTAGWGLYNIAIFSMCGFCFMAEGSLTAALSNILPISVAEISSNQTSIAAYLSTHTAGMVFGGAVGGVTMDTLGRRCVVPLALAVAFTGTTIWAFAGNREFIYAGIFILGMGVGMHSTAVRVYLLEMLPADRRGSRAALLSIFWAVGFLCASLLQLALQPLAEEQAMGFRVVSWRVVAALGACFAAFVACTCGAMAPSIRWLLAQGRAGSALDHLRRAYCLNKSRLADSFQAPRIRGCVAEVPASWRLRQDALTCTFVAVRVARHVGQCFSRSYLLLTLLATLVRVPILNGMWTDMPWMVPLQQNPCKLGQFPNVLDNLEYSSGSTKLKPEVYQSTLLLAAIIIISTTSLHFVIDFIGHRVTLFILLFFAEIALICAVIPVLFIPDEIIRCLFFGTLINAEVTFTVMCAEMFPTHIRGTANGLIPALARTFSIYVYTHLRYGDCLPVMYALLGAGGLAMVLVWLLPEYAKRPMREDAMVAAPRAEVEAGVGGRGAEEGEEEYPQRPAPTVLPRATLPTLPPSVQAAQVPSDRTRYSNTEISPINSVTAYEIGLMLNKGMQRKVKMIKNMDNSPDKFSSGFHDAEHTEFVIISDVPISPFKLFTATRFRYRTVSDILIHSICQSNVRSSRGIIKCCSESSEIAINGQKMNERHRISRDSVIPRQPTLKSHMYQKSQVWTDSIFSPRFLPPISLSIPKHRPTQKVK